MIVKATVENRRLTTAVSQINQVLSIKTKKSKGGKIAPRISLSVEEGGLMLTAYDPFATINILLPTVIKPLPEEIGEIGTVPKLASVTNWLLTNGSTEICGDHESLTKAIQFKSTIHSSDKPVDVLSSVNPESKTGIRTKVDGVTVGDSRMKLPSLKVGEETRGFEISSTELCRAIYHTRFACLEDSPGLITNKYSGVFCEITDGQMVMFATDMHRMVRVVPEITNARGGDCGFILRWSLLKKLARLCNIPGEPVSVRLNGSVIEFSSDLPGSGRVTVMSKLIPVESRPNYDKVIAASMGVEWVITANCYDLMCLLKGASLVSGEKPRGMQKTFFTPEGDRSLRITSSESWLGITEAVLPVDSNGKMEPFACDAKYLADGLDRIEDQVVTIRVAGKNNPMCVRSADGYFTYYVMPMTWES